jgi:hypothetical protein
MLSTCYTLIIKKIKKGKKMKLNKKAISRAIDIEVKRCFNCEGEFPVDELKNIYNEIVDPALFCKWCEEDLTK